MSEKIVIGLCLDAFESISSCWGDGHHQTLYFDSSMNDHDLETRSQG